MLKMTETRPTQVPVLEKMEISDILDTAIRLYRHNFVPLLEIVAIVQIVVLAGNLVMTWLFWGSVMTTSGEEVPWGALAGAAPIALVWIGALIILFPLSEAALAFATSEFYLGRRISVIEAYRRMWPLAWRLLLTMFLVYLGVWAGIAMCIIPGIIIFVWFSITTPIVAIERSWGAEALRRSYKLVSGEGWRVFATLLLLYLIVGVATYALTILPTLGLMLGLSEAQPLLAQSLVQAIQTVAQIIVRPVAMIGVVLIYYDLRIRKEGFDLVMLAEAIRPSRSDGSRDLGAEQLRPGGMKLPPYPEE